MAQDDHSDNWLPATNINQCIEYNYDGSEHNYSFSSSCITPMGQEQHWNYPEPDPKLKFGYINSDDNTISILVHEQIPHSWTMCPLNDQGVQQCNSPSFAQINTLSEAQEICQNQLPSLINNTYFNPTIPDNHNWRVPNISDALVMIDYSAKNPALVTKQGEINGFISELNNQKMWIKNGSQGFLLDLNDGSFKPVNKYQPADQSGVVLCVGGEELSNQTPNGEPRFDVSPTDTSIFFDKFTGFLWKFTGEGS